MGIGHWYNVYVKSMENPETIIDVLVDSQQVRYFFNNNILCWIFFKNKITAFK